MADAIAGPSRVATVKDEAEEYASSSVVVSTANGATANGANGDEDAQEEIGADGLPKDACETLYLHNLNEKVQIDGASAFRGGDDGDGSRSPSRWHSHQLHYHTVLCPLLC